MKDYLADLVRSGPSPLAGRQVAREYLQARLLESLQRAGAMVPLAFYGGTALRFLFSIPRFSEDLDLALERAPERYDLAAYLRQVQSDLGGENYPLDLRLSTRRAVHSALVRFPGLPFELGLSPHANEVLSIKLEVDTRPPAGARLATTLVRRHTLLHLQHHDRPSLLAGKLHALLQRDYAKGRDLYDLFWYLSDPDWPAPNLDLLSNALDRSGWTGPRPTAESWRGLVAARLAELDWAAVQRDVEPFLADAQQAALLTRDNLLELLAQA